MKNAKLLLLTVVLLLTLTGCRTRTTVPVDPIPDENGEAAEDQLGQAEQIEDAEDDPAAEEDVRPDADAPTATDPDSDRKTYAEDADAEIVPGADKTLTQQGYSFEKSVRNCGFNNPQYGWCWRNYHVCFKFSC